MASIIRPSESKRSVAYKQLLVFACMKLVFEQTHKCCSAVAVSAVSPSSHVLDPFAVADLGGGWDFQKLSAFPESVSL